MKTYELRDTSNVDLKRVVDRDGEWQHYFHVPTRRYLRGVTSILHRAWGRPQLMNWAKDQMPGVVDQRLRYGSEKGDAVHQFINRVLCGDPCNRQTLVLAEDRQRERALTQYEWDCIVSFARFWTAHAPKLVSHERTVANVKLGYAGTFDVILRLMRACGIKTCCCKAFIGKLLLLDWKSGGGIYDDMGAQVASYANADLSKILFRHRLGGTGIVRVGTKHKTTSGCELEIYSVAQTRRHFVEFQAAITIDDASYRPFRENWITDIPEEFSISVDREELGPKRRVRRKK